MITFKNIGYFIFIMRKIILLLIISLLMVGCQQSLKKTEVTKELMGTTVTITVYDDNKEEAERVIDLAFKEIERIDRLLSNYKNDSEVSLLNKNGFIENPSNDLLYNVKKALSYSEISQGAFDITVQSILDLYTDSFQNKKRAPTDEEIKETMELVNFENIFIEFKKISFKKEGMKITLGGIAKGYAVDKAVDVLEKNGIKHALVNMKSSIRAIGNKGTEDWTIALENPRNKNEYITIIRINNNSLSTSGDYERYFDEDKKFHHIINPKTGYSADELISVTIITDKAIDADALSTSVFVLGKEKGLKLIEKTESVEGLLITKDKEIIKSKGFR